MENNTLLWHGLVTPEYPLFLLSVRLTETAVTYGVLERDVSAVLVLVLVFSSRLEGFLSLTLKAGGGLCCHQILRADRRGVRNQKGAVAPGR